MISTATFITVGISLFVSLILPLVVLIVLSRKWRLNHIPSAWFLGAVGFFIPQMLIRVRLLEGFAATPNFQQFAENHFVVYGLILAFTAAFFELAGRYGVAKVLNREMTFRRSVAAGLGHGSIEAILLVGVTYVNNLIYMVMIQTGSFDAVVAQSAAAGVDVSQLYAVKEALLTTSPLLFLLASYERLLTIVCHTAMSVLVCWGVWQNRPGKSMVACLLFHTILDSTVILQGLAPHVISQNTAYVLIYGLLTVAAIVAVIILRTIYNKWNTALQEAAYGQVF